LETALLAFVLVFKVVARLARRSPIPATADSRPLAIARSEVVVETEV
jgi:hypothetical protein